MPRNLSSPLSTPRQTRSGRHAMAATNTPDQEGTHRRIRKLPSSFQPIWTPNDAFQTPNLFANPVSSATRTPPSRTSAHLNVLGSQDPGRLAAAHIGFSDPSQFKDAAAWLPRLQWGLTGRRRHGINLRACMCAWTHTTP